MSKYNVVIVKDADGNLGVQVGDEYVPIQDDIEQIINSRIGDIRRENETMKSQVACLQHDNTLLNEIKIKYECIRRIIGEDRG